VKGGKLCAVAGAEESIVAHLDKTKGEDVLQETANEFFSGQGAELGLASIGIFVSKGHFGIFQFQDVVIADGHPENVSGDVLHCGPPVADRFAVHDPFLLPNRFGNVVEEISLSQSIPELGSKDPGEGFHREQEIFASR
jgi:hypothetical protein